MRSLQTGAMSFLAIGLMPWICVSQGTLQSFIIIDIGWLFLLLEKFDSINFLGFRERWKYYASATGVGNLTPAVYTAYQIFLLLILLVTSLISIGANLLALSFLCTHKKLISAILTLSSLFSIICTGTPEINPTSFLLLVTLTPTSHSLYLFGTNSAHRKNSTE